jgi:hypothetical protein
MTGRAISMLGTALVAATSLLACSMTSPGGTTANPGPTAISRLTATPGPTPNTPNPSIPQPTQFNGGGAVPPELVGIWTQDNTSGAGGLFGRMAYQFAADGTYVLYDLLCTQDFSGTQCEDANPSELGIASASGSQLSLTPTSQSVQGPRTYAFAVVRDPNIGDLRLQFYFADYIDEWFWLPPT